MRCTLFILFLFSSFALRAADTVRITDATNLVVTGFTVATFNLNVDEPSGDATAEGSPARVYVPITNAFVDGGGNAHDTYFSQYSAAGLNRLFNINLGDKINFPLTTDATGTKYLYAAAKLSSGSGYKIVQKFSSSLTGAQNVIFEVTPNAICAQYTADCATILPTVVTNTSKVTFKLYLFLSSTSNIALGDTLDPAANTGGVFFETVMSNRIYINTELKTFIDHPRVGDRRVILGYSSDNSMLDFQKVVVFNHTAAPPVTNGPIGAYTGGLLNRTFPTAQSGDLTVNELINNTVYTLSVGFQDKFGFVTTLSDDVSITPLEIQELLKKEACFLLTAGFGEEHYIIDYFRKFRDEVLAHSWLGQKFIKVYYRAAPHYAKIIYQHAPLRWGIRSLAYILYFFFNYHLLILFIGASCYFLNIRKNKLFLQNNGL